MRESPEASSWKVQARHSDFHDSHPTTQHICIRSVSAVGLVAKENLVEFKFINGKCTKLHKWLCEAGAMWWVNQRLYCCRLVRPPWLSSSKSLPTGQKTTKPSDRWTPLFLTTTKSKIMGSPGPKKQFARSAQSGC